ncbi:TetR/AcrR family transcriptional regulator, fatty acid metabolism regulator protein [Thermotomaculum hydrothermale]|uniref:TetR/AcrR family transcriptional regulator, fatty acid metabolism regulator protein n=1 Tax=Thermotomaculum hydrothermale TaxID=981385 RepID=A0A7R6SXX1_9BACT|nr:TetR/AcrR family transcriptional regulator [Thermotomaculum hydrothermale]BBB31951.1 TetR/AcrR family transcriptional regulator, fatty acid metabolism regulator protein [Thermotomaculum hydrothermale]
MAIDFESIKKEAIIKKTKEFISNYGLNEFSMEKLAKFCGLAKGTFYNYFKSKDELITSVIENSVEEAWGNLIEKIEKCKSWTEKLQTIVSLSLSFFNENKDILILYANEIKMLDCVAPNSETMHGKFLTYHIKRITSLIGNILEESGVKKEREKIAFLIHEAIVNFAKYFIFFNREMDIKKDSEILYTFILKGMEGIK